jgi:hypothetical protein
VIRFILHTTNVTLIVGMIGCIAGALAGLIVLFPFVAGAWGLNLMALLAYEENWHHAPGITVAKPTLTDD